MSKTIKGMIMRDYKARMGGVSDAMLISIRGMKGLDTTKLRRSLAKSRIKIAVVRNALAKQTFKGSGIDALLPMLEGPSALAFGTGDNAATAVEIARKIVELLKDFPGLELKGAILDGTIFKGAAGVKELSKFPTKGEAIAQVVTLIVSPARTLMGQVKGPGAAVAGIIKSIEAKLEKGEVIAKK